VEEKKSRLGFGLGQPWISTGSFLVPFCCRFIVVSTDWIHHCRPGYSYHCTNLYCRRPTGHCRSAMLLLHQASTTI